MEKFMNQHVNRRSIMSVSVGLAAIAVPAGAAMATADLQTREAGADDPALAALATHKAAERKVTRLSMQVCDAEDKASKVHGQRPVVLIAWRYYSAIGGREIAAARDELLGEPGADPAQIELEFKDARKRYKAIVRARDNWDRRAGLADLRKRFKEAKNALDIATRQLMKTRPTTAYGASAMIDYVEHDSKIDFERWHRPALKMAAAGLRDCVSRGTAAVTA